MWYTAIFFPTSVLAVAMETAIPPPVLIFLLLLLLKSPKLQVIHTENTTSSFVLKNMVHFTFLLLMAG